MRARTSLARGACAPAERGHSFLLLPHCPDTLVLLSPPSPLGCADTLVLLPSLPTIGCADTLVLH
eukprot:2550497-Rhodomonas_salina.1